MIQAPSMLLTPLRAHAMSKADLLPVSSVPPWTDLVALEISLIIRTVKELAFFWQ